MSNTTPNHLQKFEFYAIFINNLFLLLGVSLFGWTLFDTLFLYWLEPISALVVLGYFVIVLPIKYGRPGTMHLREYQIPALKVLALSIYTLLMHYIALVFIIRLCKIEDWETGQGVLHTLAQLPGQLWSKDLLLLSIVFLLAFLLPPLLLERQGIKPSLETLPMQSKILIHPSQFVTNYLWFGVLWLAYYYGNITQPTLLITILVVLKSAYEAYLFRRIAV